MLMCVIVTFASSFQILTKTLQKAKEEEEADFKPQRGTVPEECLWLDVVLRCEFIHPLCK